MKSILRLFISLFGIIVFWYLVCIIGKIPSFILPTPLAVLLKVFAEINLIIEHLFYTLIEIVISLFVGIVAGFFTALSLQIKPILRLWIYPLLLISQAIPVYALAPVFMLWFGYGMLCKIIIAAFVIYFPIAISVFEGLQNTPREFLLLARSLGANERAILWKIRLPAARGEIASGIKIAAALAPIAAIIGEYIGGSSGLGYLISYGINRTQTDLAFAGILVCAILTLIISFSANYFLDKLR